MIMTLTIFLMASCQTTVKNDVTPIAFPVPVPPEKPNVEFQDIAEMEEKPQEGLYLSYSDGRALATYLNDMQAHREKIESLLNYYKKADSQD